MNAAELRDWLTSLLVDAEAVQAVREAGAATSRPEVPAVHVRMQDGTEAIVTIRPVQS